ncbi:hypothetical protein QE410_002506 [Microbacterium sp. SORGH_AS 1204]|nr:hypothetical protein [Microbacterium sp. SORGH_AS_1204]
MLLPRRRWRATSPTLTCGVRALVWVFGEHRAQVTGKAYALRKSRGRGEALVLVFSP